MKLFLIKYAGLLSLIWFLVILILCATPGQYVPAAGWMDLLSLDKWVHAGIFFILVFLLIVFGVKHRMKIYGSTVFTLLAVIYGGILEIMQAFLFSSRSSDWKDFVANSFGCFAALFFYRKIKRSFFARDKAAESPETNLNTKQSEKKGFENNRNKN